MFETISWEQALQLVLATNPDNTPSPAVLRLLQILPVDSATIAYQWGHTQYHNNHILVSLWVSANDWSKGGRFPAAGLGNDQMAYFRTHPGLMSTTAEDRHQTVLTLRLPWSKPVAKWFMMQKEQRFREIGINMMTHSLA